jgi:hypothetical protein
MVRSCFFTTWKIAIKNIIEANQEDISHNSFIVRGQQMPLHQELNLKEGKTTIKFENLK